VSLYTSNNLYQANNAYLEASLIKVVHIIIIDAVLSLVLSTSLNYTLIVSRFSYTILYLFFA
jgi:hypothetical protein